MHSNPALLELKSLNVSFKTSTVPIKAVNNLSFNICPSEIFGLVGESGCGKSLTALSIMGILPHNAFAEGSIYFKDTDLLTVNIETRRLLRGKEIAMIFQEPMTSLNPVLNIGRQISESLITHFCVTKKEAVEKTIQLLKDVKIPSPELRIKEYPHQMSGGMRQRIMIAMAIACNPVLLIADEPTTALDVTVQAQILELLQGLRQERRMSILLITHDLGIIAENADRVAIMYAGRIVELAAVMDLFRTPRHPYTMGLLASLPKEKGIPLEPIPGTVPQFNRLPSGCKFSDRCRFVISKCKDKEPDLLELPTSGEKHHLVRCIRAGEVKWNS